MRYLKIFSLLLVFILTMSFISAVCEDIVYPVYASDTCTTAHSEYVVDTSASQTLTQTENTFTCKSNSICRIRSPTISCNQPKALINLWLGYEPYWAINVKGYNYHSSSETDTAILSTGIEFNEGDTATYSGVCMNKAIYSPIGGALIVLQKLTGNGLLAPSTSSLQIESKVGLIWHEPALGGSYIVDGTQYCQKSEALQKFVDNMPVDNQLALTALQLSNPTAPKVSATQAILEETRFYLGTSKLTVDKYEDVPFLFNANPMGQYKGQDVICDVDKGIISVVELKTTGGDSYCVLNSRLKSTDFCCSNQQCKNDYGVNYNCEQGTYECKEIQGYCNSDIECQPTSGIMQGSNCYQKEGKFYTWESSCSNHKCVPYPAVSTEVKCCSGYCSLTNQVCDPIVKGCYTPETPQPDCPSGMCCDGETTKYAGCVTGKVCCYETDLHKGYCKDTCVPPKPECVKDEDCEDINKVCENNKCVLIPDKSEKECSSFQEVVPGGTYEDCGTFGWKKIFNSCKTGRYEATCKTAGWVYGVIIGGVFLILVITVIVMYRPKSKSKRKK